MMAHLWQRCLYQWRAMRPRSSFWDTIDERLVQVFLDTSIRDEGRYSELFSYLVSGLIYYRGSDQSRIYYPGASSIHGAAVDAMEGFCRILPMISAWVCSGRPSVIHDVVGRPIDLLEVVRTGLRAGTNPASKGYWGQIRDRDQRIVEAADIALAVWLLRHRMWPGLSLAERERIARWLLSVNGKSIPDNNWHLFPVIVNEVLSSLGCPADQVVATKHYARLKSFYLGNGWFSDGPDGEIDYYNAWGVHYTLFWINRINPLRDPEFIDGSLNAFVRNYKYFFSTDGIPITGRSICYRMAAPAPLVAAATNGMDSVSAGMARRALDCVWKYFIRNGALRHGRITQGYWQEDLRLLDNYSGPGSSLWSTRSLTLAFFNPPRARFWTGPQEALPIEHEDYAILIPEIGKEIRGARASKEVLLVTTGTPRNQSQDSNVGVSLLRRLAIHVLGLPYRPQNRYTRYELPTYSSQHPFWVVRLAE